MVTAKNSSIQCLRGIAALFVTFFHASVYATAHFGDAGWAAVFDGRFGFAGVAIFFAISGLLMTDLIQRSDPWRFLSHRIVRIYPPYFLAVSLAVPIIGLLGIRKFGPHVLSLLLAPVGLRTYYLSVEWTLIFECTYYVALFLIAVAGWHRHLNRIVLAWLGLLGAAPLLTGWYNEAVLYPVYSIWLSAANVAFAGGLLIPWIARNIRIPVGTGILALCIAMIAMPSNFTAARWVAGITAALLVLDAVRIKLSPLTLLSLRRLGDWSYALYLTHVPGILVVYHFWPRSAGIGAAWLSAVAVAIAVSAGFGMVDVQMYRYLKNATDLLSEEDRRRWVNIGAGVFIIASLVGLVIT